MFSKSTENCNYISSSAWYHHLYIVRMHIRKKLYYAMKCRYYYHYFSFAVWDLFEMSFIFQPLIFILSNSRLGDVPLFVYRRSNFRLWVAGIRYNHDRVLISTGVVESCLTRGVVGFCVIRKLPIALWLTSWFVFFDVTFTPYPSKLFYLGAHALNLVIILSVWM